MNYAKVRDISVDEIPVIDVSGLEGGDDRQLRAVADQMVRAAEGIGFFYVRGHGVSRDMLDETLVIWGGEFGRTVYAQGNPNSFSHSSW